MTQGNIMTMGFFQAFQGWGGAGVNLANQLDLQLQHVELEQEKGQEGQEDVLSLNEDLFTDDGPSSELVIRLHSGPSTAANTPQNDDDKGLL
jgi:hypothetical protein